MKLTTQRMLGWRTLCLRGLIMILGLMAAAAVASAQESKSAEEAGTTTKPRDTSKGPNLDVPAKRIADPKMPDISGTWQMGKQGEFGEAVIRRIEDASDDFAWQAPGDKNGRDQRLKWSPEAQRFEVTNIDRKPNRSARITLQVLANGKTMRVVYDVDEQAKQELQKATEFSDSQLAAFLNQEWTRTKKPVGKAAKLANPSTDSDKPVPAGMRVASVPIDPAMAGGLGLIRPGDRVDVSVASARAVGSREVGKVVSEITTVLECVEVFAIDGVVDPNLLPKAGDPKAAPMKNVSLLVTSEQARQLKQASDVGTIHLALRGANDLTKKADSKMPDLTGTWSVKFVSPAVKAAPIAEMEIRRVQTGATDFLIDQPWIETVKRISVKWSAARQRFEGEWDDDGDLSKITLQPLADSNTMRVIIANTRKQTAKETSNDGGTSESKWGDLITQEWTRTSLTFSTTFFAKRFGLPETVVSSENGNSPERGSDRIGGGVRRPDLAPQSLAIPVTPAAKQLVEQLVAQESAAAAEAATIRQLQANGQAEQNRQPLAEHQRKLKNLLSTAFDLKLQLEELQVKELQSRLSRLERQIGQRKELREKIINRRAGELIEGDALRWDATVPSPTKLPGQTVGDNKKPAKAATTEVDELLGAPTSKASETVSVATAALMHAAEARKKVAEYDLERAVDSNKKVPDAIPPTMIERLKANLEIANAELDAAKGGVDISRPSPSPSNSSVERTFDGTPYSQWLKMLETERKPDKLATAMEACARLAATGDERRIARGLFIAAKLFESTDNTKERNLVWDAGTAALKRLPGEAVVAELLAALHDEQSKDAREFHCRFLISVATSPKTSIPDRLKAALKLHDQELVTTLLKAWGRVYEFQNSPISSSPLPKSKSANSEIRTPDPLSGNNRLLAGAASAWLISERKLSEFDGLRPLVMQAIDEVYSRTTGRIDRREQPWLSASSRVVATEPETPGLAILLAKHINQDRTQIAGRLRDMGTHAEPAVPLLIEDFLVHWKNRETELWTSAAQLASEFDDERPKSGEFSAIESMKHVLDVLGAIGPKAKSAVPLLRQIAVLAPPKRAGQPSLNDQLFDAVKKSLALIGDAPADEPQEAPILLSEFSRLQRCWNLLSLTPNADHKDIQFEFDWQLSIEDKHVRGNFEVVTKVMNHIGAPSNRMHYRINDTVTPRQIELIDQEQRHRQLGIYELKGNRLKIELAKPNLPRPKEFSADPNKLPEGHVLLELDRGLGSK